MKHRLDGRSYNDRIGKPYYGHSLRRVIEPEVCDPSLVERITTAYNGMTLAEIRLLTFVIIACVFCAALIVML